MKITKLSAILAILSLGLGIAAITKAQGMMNFSSQSISNETRQEETAGKDLWQNLQNKTISCDKSTDDDYELLGEYFMGQMTGNSHDAMNRMMEYRLGPDGERQMHVVMGKRFSACDETAAYPVNGSEFFL